MKNRKSLYEQCLSALEKYPDARNSDKRLWIAVVLENAEFAKKVGTTDYKISIYSIFGLPGFDSVSRMRRYIQYRDGLYPPTNDKIKKRRKAKAKAIAQAMAADDVSIFDTDQINLSIKLVDD